MGIVFVSVCIMFVRHAALAGLRKEPHEGSVTKSARSQSLLGCERATMGL